MQTELKLLYSAIEMWVWTMKKMAMQLEHCMKWIKRYSFNCLPSNGTGANTGMSL